MANDSMRIDTPNGETTAYIARPTENAEKAVIVVQEYWGLNDHIKSIAGRFADEGFLAIAPDLYRGQIAADSGEASELMKELAVDDGIETIRAAVNAAQEQFGVGHFGIIGFCMGGTYALRAACLVDGISAAAAFYGDIPSEDVLSKLTVPTIFVSAKKDSWIDAEKVAALEDVVERYELPLESVKYDADHAFFNDTRPEVYDKAAAEDAWARVTSFFSDRL